MRMWLLGNLHGVQDDKLRPEMKIQGTDEQPSKNLSLSVPRLQGPNFSLKRISYMCLWITESGSPYDDMVNAGLTCMNLVGTELHWATENVI